MEAKPQAETPSVRRPSTPAERRALWQGVQQVWRKRATDAMDVIAQMREAWDRESPASKRHEAVYTLDTHAIIYSLDRDPAVIALLDRLFDNVDATFDVSTVTALALYSYPDLHAEEEAGITRLLTDRFVVPLDSRLARYAGYLRRLYRLKTPDSAMAATAMLTKTTLLTRNVHDCRPLEDVKVQEIEERCQVVQTWSTRLSRTLVPMLLSVIRLRCHARR